jgi:phage tail sheath protein FI
MPLQPTYPGVYIEEIPSGVRTIAGISTSIAAFIDYFRRGPMNRAVRIFSFGDFEREFGGLDALSEASYSIQQFFLNGGSQAYVVRVAGGAATSASVAIGAATGAATVLTLAANNEGTWGNSIRARIDHNTVQPNEFNLSVAEYDASGLVLRQEKFLNLSIDAASPRRNFAGTVLNDANTGSKIVQVIATSGTNPPASNGTISGLHVTDTVALPALPHDLNMIVDGGTPVPLILLGLQVGANNLYAIALSLENAIRAASPSNPIFANSTVRFLGSRLHISAGGNAPGTIITFSNLTGTLGDTLRLTAGGAPPASPNSQEYQLGTGAVAGSRQLAGGIVGTNGTVPNAAAIIGSLNSKTGIHALEDVDLFNIMCIPRTAMTSVINNPISATEADTVMSTAIEYCRQKRAFFIMDTPLGIDELPEITNWMAARDTLRSDNAAIYYPRVQSPDPLDNYRLRSFGASGTIAGLYARTDSNRGIWKAPAGTEANLRNVTQLDDVLNDRENGALNPLGINCLRNLPVYGNICWGGRTLAGADANASEWKYVPVRRLAYYLEESLFRGLHWVVFEPNDEPLWAQIRLNVGAFMNNLFKQGAFQGTSPREAYLVKCDRETTTQNDINLGVVNILVGFAPLKPAEFVFIKIQQLAGQIQS